MLQVNLEAFQTSLHGCRILLQGPFQDKCPPILESIQNIREPFKKKVLLTSRTNFFTNSIDIPYDTCYRITTGLDWSLALNYIQHLVGQQTGTTAAATSAQGPVLIVIEDLDTPDGFFYKFINNNKITIVHYITTPIKLKPSIANIYDTIFFPFQIDVGAQQSQSILTILQTLYRPGWTISEFKEIMTEIRTAGAGLCWTRVGGGNKNGAIFWYDPISFMRSHQQDRKMLSDILRWTANQL